MARCRRLCTMQAEFARVFSVQWWTVGRTAAFLESDGMLAASSDLMRMLRRGGWPVQLTVIATAGGLVPDAVYFGAAPKAQVGSGRRARQSTKRPTVQWGSHGSPISLANLRQLCESGVAMGIISGDGASHILPKLRTMPSAR